ncbi:MAG TPA: TetR-like C-terminal domain-containing protein [Actinomycetes bacterium]|nr:TetR-like C-terminal domain-containing protein [Actinomycetes bacterium]
MARAGVTPEKVESVAADVVDEAGWETLTLAAVAGRLGVSVPSLYKHVDGMAGVRRRLTIRAVSELAQRLVEAAVGRAGPDALGPVAHAYRDFARQHPGLYAATVVAPTPGDHEHHAASDRVLMPVLAMIDGYGVPGDQAIDAARLLRATLHGFVSLELAGGFGLPVDVDTSFDRTLAALDRSLSTWPPQAG